MKKNIQLEKGDCGTFIVRLIGPEATKIKNDIRSNIKESFPDLLPIDIGVRINRQIEERLTRLVQTDWDYPGFASTFGWSPYLVQRCPGCNKSHTYTRKELKRKYVKCFEHQGPCGDCRVWEFDTCDHDRATDGTVACESCGIPVGDFLESAREWLEEHDGARAEDPGYF